VVSMTATLIKEIRPCSDAQAMFLGTDADIAIYGGAAGGGKTYALLLDPIRHFKVPNFGGVIFRRTFPMITAEGGLWDTSKEIYGAMGGQERSSWPGWVFKSGAKIKFSHLQYDKDVINWQGAQLPFVGFDELTQFTTYQFWYMISRLRSPTGIRAYARATCNPDPVSWVKELIQWWIDEDTGFAIPERAGVVRWFIRQEGKIIWADKPEDFPVTEMPMSLTFIPAKVWDNPILLETNPQYVANLRALPTIERRQLLEGDWNARRGVGSYFKSEWFHIVDSLPEKQVTCDVRSWDRAATEKTETSTDPDWTVSVKMRHFDQRKFCITDVQRGRWSSGRVDLNMAATAQADGQDVEIIIEQEPGSAGVKVVKDTQRSLAGYPVRVERPTGDKAVRAIPLSAAAERGEIFLLRGSWNEAFINELCAFDDEDWHDDQVDAASQAYNWVNRGLIGLGRL